MIKNGIFYESVGMKSGMLLHIICCDADEITIANNMADNNSDDYVHGKPSEGMCCACTYEDITEEDQNYGKCVIAIAFVCRSISHTFTYCFLNVLWYYS